MKGPKPGLYEGEGEGDEPLVETRSETQGALRESAPLRPLAARRDVSSCTTGYRPRPAVPLPAPAKPSSQLAGARAEACRCLASPFPSLTYRVRPLPRPTGRFEIPPYRFYFI